MNYKYKEISTTCKKCKKDLKIHIDVTNSINKIVPICWDCTIKFQEVHDDIKIKK